RRRERVGDVASVAGKPEASHTAARQWDLALDRERCGVEELGAAGAVLVGLDQKRATGPVDRASRVPVRFEDVAPRTGRDVVAGDGREVAALVGAEEEPRRIRQP